VDLTQPDFEKFPRFHEALANAQQSELGPGDAIFIPAVWWHHVESFKDLNMLVNYWWSKNNKGQMTEQVSPVKALMHCLMSMKQLSPEHRDSWGQIFAHYAFSSDPARFEHIPAQYAGVLGEMTAQQVKAVMEQLFPKT